MSIAHLLVAYVTLTLALVLVTGMISEMRRRRFGPSRPEDRVFRCRKCQHVYTDDADVDRSRCPHCGKSNEPIEF